MNELSQAASGSTHISWRDGSWRTSSLVLPLDWSRNSQPQPDPGRPPGAPLSRRYRRAPPAAHPRRPRSRPHRPECGELGSASLTSTKRWKPPVRASLCTVSHGTEKPRARTTGTTGRDRRRPGRPVRAERRRRAIRRISSPWLTGDRLVPRQVTLVRRDAAGGGCRRVAGQGVWPRSCLIRLC